MYKPLITGSLILILAGCRPGTVPSGDKPVISVSILPQQFFIERLAGDHIEVNVLVPPGASPASYEPTASQLYSLGRSSLYFRIGYVGFELGWLEKIRAVNPRMEILDLSTGISLITGEESDDHGHTHDHPHMHGGTDPHIWMSARNAKIFVPAIYESLLVLLPGEKSQLTENFRELMADLDSLDLAIGEMMDGLDRRTFMIFHPALSYFARDYGLEQYSIELEGKSPSPGHMKQMSDLGREKKISTIFIQAQFDQENASTLADEIGASVVQIDPLDPNWHEQMLFIASQLKATL